MNATLETDSPISSSHYWRGIFARNPDFCSWQTPKQARVRRAVRKCLSETSGRVRVLDFGIGSLGLYRSLEDELMERIQLTGISESLQHDAADPWLACHSIEVAIGPGLAPLAHVPAASQDRVVCTYVLDYLSDQMRADALAAFARVMAMGAKLVLVLHHPRGRRAEKFRRSQPFWSMARAVYDHLSNGRHAQANALLHELHALLNTELAPDARYRGYLASYLKTAQRFLSELCEDGRLTCTVPDAALLACEHAASSTDRERAMTCDALRPIEHPARDLVLPRALRLCDLFTHIDPTDGAPMAYVLTAELGCRT